MTQDNLLPDTLSHATLCEIAVRWLYGAGRCKFVARECSLTPGEQPDAIGWHWWDKSVLVECKATRADFLADQKKPFRGGTESTEFNWTWGMGRERYYLCPKDLIKPEELPERWGLIYVYPSGTVRKVKAAEPFERWNEDFERFMLFKLLARLAGTGRWHQIEAAWMQPVSSEPLPLPAPLYDEVSP